MAVARHREFDQRMGLTGNLLYFWPSFSLSVETATAGPHGSCDDSVSGRREKRTPNSLLIDRSDSQFPTFSGSFVDSGGVLIKQLSNCPTNFQPTEPSPGEVFTALTTVEESNLAWESLAATNPNVAHVSLPSYWAELKDLPSLWRDWGDSFIKNGKLTWSRIQNMDISHSAKAHLWYRWGIAPLLSDIRKMFSFTEAVSQRIKWLSRLQSGDRVLKRRATLRTNSQQGTPSTVAMKSTGATIFGTRTVLYTEKVWCTVQWKLDGAAPIPGVGLELDPLWIKAHQLTFGLTTHDAMAALWQIMPWSWFVDWFIHVSTIMDATNNTIPMTWGPICLMRHTTATATCTPDASSADLVWCKPSGPHRQTRDVKKRLIVSPILPFAPSLMPVFTNSQWSILASLAVLRGRR